MEAAIEQHHFYVDHRIAGQHASAQYLADTFVDGRNIFAGNHAAFDVINKFVTFVFVGFQTDDDVGKLASATCLLGVLVVAHRFGGDGFAISHRRLTNLYRYSKIIFYAIDDDFEVQLAHPRNYGLVGFVVVAGMKRRVFVGEFGQRFAQFALVLAFFRRYLQFYYRGWHVNRFEQQWHIFVAKRVAGFAELKSDQSHNLAG